MWAVQGSRRLGKRKVRSPTAMIRLLRSAASISLHHQHHSPELCYHATQATNLITLSQVRLIPMCSSKGMLIEVEPVQILDSISLRQDEKSELQCKAPAYVKH